jgi:hypothetical protein
MEPEGGAGAPHATWKPMRGPFVDLLEPQALPAVGRQGVEFAGNWENNARSLRSGAREGNIRRLI